MKTDQVNFYLYELFQIINTDVADLMETFFLDYSKRSPLFSHQLIWQCMVEKDTKEEEDRHYDNNRQKREKAGEMIGKVMLNFTSHEATVFNEINTFLQTVTKISSLMKPDMPKEMKTQIIRDAVEDIQVPKFAYLPTNPHMRVVKIIKTSGRPMQSAARCPFLLSFKCERIEDINVLLRNDGKERKKIDISDMDEGKTSIDIKHLNASISQLNKPRNMVRKSKNSIFNQNSISKAHSRLHNFENISAIVEEMKSSSIQKGLTPVKLDTLNKTQKFENQERLNTLLLDDDKSFLDDTGKNKDDTDDGNLITISCIFKTKDDLRNDTLTLKYIALIAERYKQEKVSLYLKPYNTFSNRTGEVS